MEQAVEPELLPHPQLPSAQQFFGELARPSKGKPGHSLLVPLALTTPQSQTARHHLPVQDRSRMAYPFPQALLIVELIQPPLLCNPADMVLSSLVLAVLAADKITYPAMGSPLRKQILDSIRPYTYVKDLTKVKFIVPHMAVKGKLALVQCMAEDPDAIDEGPFVTEGELTACFVAMSGSKWKPIGFIRDPHEGISPGRSYVVDLRKASKLGFTKSMFPPKADDMSKALSILGDVRRLGFTYGWFLTGDVQREIALSGSEIDEAKKLPDGHFSIRGTQAWVFRPEMP